MNRQRRRILALGVLVIVLLALVAAGCGGEDEAAEPTPVEESTTATQPGEETAPAEEAEPAVNEELLTQDSLVVLQEDIAPGLDVDGANAAHFGVHMVLENIMEPLIEYPATDEDGILVPNYQVTPEEFEPRLAESWTSEPGPDNTVVWTFKLRQGVKSCAGNEFTADDVVWMYARAKSVSGASPVSWFLANVSSVLGLEVFGDDPSARELLDSEVKKIDDYTVQITQKNPNGLFPRVLEIFALFPFDSKEVLKHATDDDPWAHTYTDTQNSPGFGPYCLKQWTKGQEIVLEANPNYYRGQPQFKTVTIRRVPQAANRVAAIQSGDADIVTSLTPQDIAALRESENVTVLSWYNNEILALGFNFALEPWNTPEGRLIRQAIAYAMPVQEIIEADYLGDAKPWYGLSESSYFGFVPIETYATQDLEKAKQLLAEAGYPNGQGLEQFADAFQLNYVTERREVLEPIANRIKTALAQIGIEITLNPITAQAYNDRELTKRDMPMFLRDLVRPFGPDVGYTSLLFYVSVDKGGLVNAGNYSNPEFDEAFFASQTSVGEERLEHLRRQQEILMEDLPLVPIVERPSQVVFKAGLTCWQTGTSNTIGFWYLTVEGSDRPCTTEPR